VGATALPAAGVPGARPRELTQNGWRTSADGTFVLRSLPEGEVRVYAWVMAADGLRASENAAAVLRVGPGDAQQVELRMRPVGP
jgi:hypothetical protein